MKPGESKLLLSFGIVIVPKTLSNPREKQSARDATGVEKMEQMLE